MLSSTVFDGECESELRFERFEAEEVEVEDRVWCYQILRLCVLEAQSVTANEPEPVGKLSSGGSLCSFEASLEAIFRYQQLERNYGWTLWVGLITF